MANGYGGAFNQWVQVEPGRQTTFGSLKAQKVHLVTAVLVQLMK